MSILDRNTPQSYVPYLATGTGIFGAIGDPNGVQNGGIGSIYVNLLNGDVYVKTTVYATLTGWNLLGGGSSGTVTDFSAGDLSPLFTSSVATSTTTPALTFAQISQAQNLVYASPNGSTGNPTFRALTSSDLSLAAAPPANGVQYNDGTNAFTASNGFLFDAASNTVQAGESTVLKGTLQMFAALSAGSVKHTVNNPAGNYVFIWGDSLPANNDLARFSVSGSNVTIESIAASALGFPSINATDGVIPYRSSSSAFSDSPIVRNGANQISIGNSGSFAGLQITGNAAGGGVTLEALSSSTNESIRINPKGGGDVIITTLLGSNTFNDSGYALSLAGALRDPTNFFIGNSGSYLGLLLGNTLQVKFSSTTNWYDTVDAGLARRQANYIRVTNGSTGIGGLLVGGSTATPVGQTHLINGATGTIPLFLEAIASTSVATIKAETSGIQSFAFNPSGKLIGGCNVPTSNQQFSALGNAKSDVSTIGNVGTGVDNLLAFNLGGNVLNNTGDYVEFDAFGEFENNANNKELKIVYGATTIFATGALPFGTAALANWRINAKILRTSASSQKCIVTFWCNDATTSFLQQITTSAEDMTASKTIQFTAEATATDDIIQLHLESKLTVALTS